MIAIDDVRGGKELEGPRWVNNRSAVVKLLQKGGVSLHFRSVLCERFSSSRGGRSISSDVLDIQNNPLVSGEEQKV